MYTENLIVQEQIQLVSSIDVGQLIDLRLQNFRRLSAGNEGQLLHRIRGAVIEIDLCAAIALSASRADITVYHENDVSRLVHLKNFKVPVVREGSLIQTVRIMEGKQTRNPVFRHVQAVQHTILGKGNDISTLALSHLHIRIPDSQDHLFIHKGGSVLRKIFAHGTFIIQQVHPFRSGTDPVDLLHERMNRSLISGITHQILHRDRCCLTGHVQNGEYRFRLPAHIQTSPAKLIQTAVDRHPAQCGIVFTGIRLHIDGKRRAGSIVKGILAERSDKIQLFLHAGRLLLNHPHIVRDFPFVLQRELENHTVFRFFIDQILQDNIRLQNTVFLRNCGHLCILHQPCPVGASHFKGQGVHLRAVSQNSDGNSAVRPDGQKPSAHVFLFHLSKIAVHHIDTQSVRVHIDQREPGRLHIRCHIRISSV